MFKKIIILSLFLFLNNCGPTGSALLGPAFTGATTKSMTRTGLSYSSGHLVKKTKEKLIKIKETKTVVYQKVGQLQKKNNKDVSNKVVLTDKEERDFFFKAVNGTLKKYN